MKEIWQKYKLWIIIALVLISAGVIALVYFAILKKGKTQGMSQVLATIPNPADDEPYTSDELLLIRSYTDRLEADLGSFWNKYLFTDTDLYDSLAVTTDRVLKGCYVQYQLDGNGDLIASMNGEQKWELGSSGVAKTFNRLKALIQ